MIRSSACQPWQPDRPGHAGDGGGPPQLHHATGHDPYMLVRELDLAASFLEKALLIDPNSAWAWQRSGWLDTYRSRSKTAIEHFERSLRLSPLDPINFN